jgi:hypothetical protein
MTLSPCMRSKWRTLAVATFHPVAMAVAAARELPGRECRGPAAFWRIWGQPPILLRTKLAAAF